MLKNQPNLENTIYREAINQLIEIQNTTIPTFTLPYDFKVLVKEVLLFADWYLSALQIPQKSKNLLDILNPLFEKVLKQKPTLVLRDYHAENLIWLPKRNKNKRVGLLDYQDALAGHPAYDLASLLKDARRDVSFKLRDELTDYFLKQTKFDRELFLRDYSILSAQRNLKIIGIFARLSIRDNKPGYLNLIPRVWKNLQDDLLHPSLTELSSFIKINVPEPTVSTLQKINSV